MTYDDTELVSAKNGVTWCLWSCHIVWLFACFGLVFVCLVGLQSAGKTWYLLQGQKMNVLLIKHNHPFLGFQPFLQWLRPSRLQSKDMQ